MFQLMALASVLARPIFSVYPIAASASTMRTVAQGMVKPRISIKDHVNNTIYVMWSRDDGLDSVPGSWYEPNHFIPLIRLIHQDSQSKFHGSCQLSQENNKAEIGLKKSSKGLIIWSHLPGIK